MRKSLTLMAGNSARKTNFAAIELGAGGESGCVAQPANKTGISAKMQHDFQKAFLFFMINLLEKIKKRSDFNKPPRIRFYKLACKL